MQAEIALKMSYQDLVSLCRTDKTLTAMCRSTWFWKRWGDQHSEAKKQAMWDKAIKDRLSKASMAQLRARLLKGGFKPKQTVYAVMQKFGNEINLFTSKASADRYRDEIEADYGDEEEPEYFTVKVPEEAIQVTDGFVGNVMVKAHRGANDSIAVRCITDRESVVRASPAAHDEEWTDPEFEPVGWPPFINRPSWSISTPV